jgi:tetratricopeptide (TPR) repeat protein
MDEGRSALLGLLILAGCIGFMWSRGYRMRRAWRKSIEALEAGDMATAVKWLQSCVRQSPSFVPARRLLGRTLVALRRFDEAEKHLRLAAQFEPRNAEGHLELAMFLANCPPLRLDEAVEHLAKAFEFAPKLRTEAGQMPQLASLRQHGRFQDLTGSGHENAKLS